MQSDQKTNLSTTYGKVPPQAIEVELYVLGALLNEPYRYDDVVEIITTEEVFYKESHRIIFEAIVNLKTSGRGVDLLSVSEQLKKDDKLEYVGGNYGLAKISMDVVSCAETLGHCRILLEKYIARQMIAISAQIIEDCYNDSTEVFESLEYAEKSFYDLTYQNMGAEPLAIKEDIIPIMEEIYHKMENNIEFSGVPTGFSHLDRLTGGWKEPNFIILAARPSVGKSALALNFAYNAATLGYGVLFYSLEMGRNQLVKRLMSIASSVPLDSINNPTRLNKTNVQSIQQYNNSLVKAPIFIDDTAGITVAEIKGKSRRLIKKYGIKLIIIDYLQLMEGSKGHKGNREQEISKISRELKKLAKELKIPVIALAQLSRGVEQRGQNKPRLSDLRESGSLEQDADIVGFIYKPEQEDITQNPELANANYLGIAKHRDGSLDDMPIFKDLTIQKFSDRPMVNPEPQQFDNPNAGIRKHYQDNENDQRLPF